MTLSERLREHQWSNPIDGEAADLIDAQAERVKALEGALWKIVAWESSPDSQIGDDEYVAAFDSARALLE